MFQIITIVTIIELYWIIRQPSHLWIVLRIDAPPHSEHLLRPAITMSDNRQKNKLRFYSTMRIFISLGKQLSRRVLDPSSFDFWSRRRISGLMPGVHRWATTHSHPRERMYWNFTRDHRQSEFEPWSRLQQCKRYCSHRRDQNEGDHQRSNRDFAAFDWYLNSESSDADRQICIFAVGYHNAVWNRNERILCAHWSIFSPMQDREAHWDDTGDEGSWRNPTVYNPSNVRWSEEQRKWLMLFSFLYPSVAKANWPLSDDDDDERRWCCFSQSSTLRRASGNRGAASTWC